MVHETFYPKANFSYLTREHSNFNLRGMKKLFLSLLATLSFVGSEAQILYDYEMGPTREDLMIEKFSPNGKFHYAWNQGWKRAPSTGTYTANLIDVKTLSSVCIHYTGKERKPFFIMESIQSSQLDTYLRRMYEIGYRHVTADELFRPGVGGIVLHWQREPMRVEKPKYVLTNSPEILVFIWFKDYQISTDNESLVSQ